MRLESQKEEIKLANRTYEVMYIAEPETTDDVITQLNESIEKLIVDGGGTIVKTEVMGLQRMAYPIQKREDGYYVLFEIDGSGQEIAELERRMRVNDLIMRYLTVRVDEERKTAAAITAKREKKRQRVTDLMNSKGMGDASAEESDQGGDE
jgi:small subunit ribosomal protein S6